MELPDRVGRVVSLVPSLTEWLVVTGVGERLVGVTDWCVEPAGALDGLARVRGTKNPDLAAVRGLEPDLVVANAEENRKLDVQRLEAGGLAVFVTMPTTVAGAVGELRDLAAAVGDLPGAAALDADLVAAVADAYRRQPARRVRYACPVWRDPWLWLGRRTYAADLLGLAGGEPVLDDPATRYPSSTSRSWPPASPRWSCCPPSEFGQADAAEVAAAFAGARVELADGRALTWYGPASWPPWPASASCRPVAHEREHLTDGWEPDLPVGDTLLRRSRSTWPPSTRCRRSRPGAWCCAATTSSRPTWAARRRWPTRPPCCGRCPSTGRGGPGRGRGVLRRRRLRGPVERLADPGPAPARLGRRRPPADAAAAAGVGPVPPVPAGLRVERVTGAGALRDWERVAVDGFPYRELQPYRPTERGSWPTAAALWVGYEQDRAVCVGCCSWTPGWRTSRSG